MAHGSPHGPPLRADVRRTCDTGNSQTRAHGPFPARQINSIHISSHAFHTPHSRTTVSPLVSPPYIPTTYPHKTRLASPIPPITALPLREHGRLYVSRSYGLSTAWIIWPRLIWLSLRCVLCLFPNFFFFNPPEKRYGPHLTHTQTHPAGSAILSHPARHT
jgi:hypothetical protein